MGLFNPSYEICNYRVNTQESQKYDTCHHGFICLFFQGDAAKHTEI